MKELKIRYSKGEKEQLKKMAEEKGMTLNEFIKERSVKSKVIIEIDE